MKLEKYLNDICDVYTESASTNSKYYKIGSCNIRVSDHLNNEDDSDLNILIPLEQNKKAKNM